MAEGGSNHRISQCLEQAGCAMSTRKRDPAPPVCWEGRHGGEGPKSPSQSDSCSTK